VGKAYYSVPTEYLGHEVWVRWDARTVRVFNHRWEEVTLHARARVGRFSTHDAHIASEKITGVERGAAFLLSKIQHIGSHATRWSEAMLVHRGVQGIRVLQGLLALTRKHTTADLEKASELAWRHQAYELRVLRKLAQRQEARQEVMDFIDEHPLIRPMSEYQQFVHEQIQGGMTSDR
jgi:hypothetical protein